jgi:hypothetical protein
MAAALRYRDCGNAMRDNPQLQEGDLPATLALAFAR